MGDRKDELAKKVDFVARQLCKQRGGVWVVESVGHNADDRDVGFAISLGSKTVWCAIDGVTLIRISNTELVDRVALALEVGIAELRGVALPMAIRGTFRIHFNRHGAAPLVWCVAIDEWELAVSSVSIRCGATTIYAPKSTADDEDGKPSAWIAATGVLTLRGGEAIITADGAPWTESR